MPKTIHLEILTPEGKTFADDVEMVVLPGMMGELGVLRGHEPLVTSLQPGEIRITKDKKETRIAVGSGFAKINADKVLIMTPTAVRADELDKAAAEEARKRAAETLAQKMGAQEEATVEASLEKSLAGLRLKRRRRDQRP
ncbi:MAG: ATP synthase F1 subunit epsilon [Verrucomicrobia bacterium]|nr:ATP synthase F1 subunit epsilon [Verrucomicrobiota bacterium]